MKAIVRFLCLSLLLSACDTPLGLTARLDASRQVQLRASLQTTATGQVLVLPDPSTLPAGLRQAQEIRALLDNSNSIYTVTRNADGSLTIPLPAGRSPDSQGRLEVILTDEKQQSYFLRLETGALLRLGEPPILVSPAGPIFPGSPVSLQLNPADPSSNLKGLRFNWSYAFSPQGPWTALSGSSSRLNWEPGQAGNYYFRVETVDTHTQASSLYTSPVALLNVLDSRRIAQTEPTSGAIRLGQSIQLQAVLPEVAAGTRYLWFVSQSAQGPFQPLAEEGARIVWEPKVAGSYFIRIQTVPVSGEAATYTSSETLVQVSEADDVIQTEPASGSLIRGERVLLRAHPPGGVSQADGYRWFYSNSPQGPFSPISGDSATVYWSPEQTGEFYLRLRLFDSQTQQERTFTSSKALVSVRDSNESFLLTPQPANLIRGQSVQIKLQRPEEKRSISWFYAPSPQGPFTSIAGQGMTINWSPLQAGSYYLRAEASGNHLPKSVYTSATALVTVAEGSNAIQLEPQRAIGLGESLRLSANIPLEGEHLRYNWSFSLTPGGPWLPIQSLDADLQARSLDWYPAQSGNYYLKMDVTDPVQGTRQSFTSPTAIAFVTDTPVFFQTSPMPASIGSQGAVTLMARFNPPTPGFIYAWSYGLTATGPFTAIGGSIQPQITWKQPGIPGNYYIKMDAIDTISQRSLSFVSSNPLVFVTESQTSTQGF